MDALVEETVVSTQSIIERSSPSQTMSSNVVSTTIAARSTNSTAASTIATSQARANGTVVFTPPNQVKQAIAIPQPGGSVSIVHVAIPNNQPVHVQSVIQQPNQQSVIQAPGGTTTATLQSLPKNVILLNKLTGQGSVIHSADGDSGVHPVQLISAKSESDNETVTAVLSTTEDESKKRRELLARRPSYRKILSELSSTETHTAVATLGTATTATAELKDDGTTANINAVMRPVSDFSSDQSNEETVVDDGEGGSTITVGGTQYHTSAGLLKVVPAGAIQLATQDATGNIQGLQTLTMSNAGGGTTGTIVQYAQGGDGQFFVPVTVSAADLQAYGIRTTGNTGSSLGQSVVMTQSGTIQSPVHMVEEVSRKRELRLLKNREAAKECRRKKKEYIKCLENRVAVLENQNKALIEELKSLKDIYCQKND